MAAIPDPQDPTLAAIDRVIEAKGNRDWRGPALPMSAIGLTCDRAIWYGFRWAALSVFTAESLKRFDDGNQGETLMAARLRLVDDLTLWTIDPETGKQWALTDHNGHMRGSIDGVVLGLLQAPKTPHIWEHKQVDEKSLRKLDRIKASAGEKNALRQWKPYYWATAQLYMSYAEMDRHYMTVSSPGGRQTTSVRTEADPAEAEVLRARAKRIIEADRAPVRISEDPSWHECRNCEHHAVCHQGEFARVSCRTCLSSSPAAEGNWHCARWDRTLNREDQRLGCSAHLFLPSLIAGEQTDADEAGEWVEYRMRDGSIWRDGGKP